MAALYPLYPSDEEVAVVSDGHEMGLCSERLSGVFVGKQPSPRSLSQSHTIPGDTREAAAAVEEEAPDSSPGGGRRPPAPEIPRHGSDAGVGVNGPAPCAGSVGGAPPSLTAPPPPPPPGRARARTYPHGATAERANLERGRSAPDGRLPPPTAPRPPRGRALSHGTPLRAGFPPDGWDCPSDPEPAASEPPGMPSPRPLRRGGDAPGDRASPRRPTIASLSRNLFPADDDAARNLGADPRGAPRGDITRSRGGGAPPVTAAAAASSSRSPCRGRFTTAQWKRARIAVCVGLYLVLMVIDRAGLLSSDRGNRLESDFGREIDFRGIGVAYINEELREGDDDSRSLNKGDSITGENRKEANDKISGKATGTSLPAGNAFSQNGGKRGKRKKRRPAMAQARTMGQNSAPIFVPKEPALESPNFRQQAGNGLTHRGGRKIQSYVLSEEDLMASPEDLLPPPSRGEGPSTAAKVAALAAWAGLSLLVLETGCREVRRRFRYVWLRQLRARSEARFR